MFGTVTATLSRGPERHDVPVLRGMSLDAAQSAIQGAHLSYGDASYAFNDKVDKGVVLRDGTEIATASMVWTAGVRPNDVVHDGAPRRLEVDDHLRVVGAEGAFAIGDVAAGYDKRGKVLPMTSPPAMQAGRYVARHILDGGARRPFRYRDKGALATIGRRAALMVSPVS